MVRSELNALMPDFETVIEAVDEPINGGVYEPGDEYAFYRDLSSLVQAANTDILIVDGYLSEQVFNLYVSKVPNGTSVRILSKKIGLKRLSVVATEILVFRTGPGRVELGFEVEIQ
jgi:hypothetical protein